MSDTEDLHVGDFNPSTYEHVLPEGAHDFDDYDSDYAEQHPELGFTDEQVEAEVAKLDPDAQMNRSRQKWQNWIQMIRNFMKNTMASWTLTTASMAKSLKCQT